MEAETIAAIATPMGEGGIGIVRLSGSKAIEIAAKMFKTKKSLIAVKDIRSYQAIYGNFFTAAGELIDEGLILIMRAPHSYTREDVVEFQSHGGIISLKRLLEQIIDLGAKLAEPGEFTKRAFLNGRIDLSQAQAVMDIIRAKTEVSQKISLAHLDGKLAQKIAQYRQELLELIAHIEALIDFPDEDIDTLNMSQLADKITDLLKNIQNLLSTERVGKIFKDGLETVIIGTPNVGKSSLLNLLMNEDRAIVTDIPGTTRDSLEELVNVRGIPLKIVDTAGIRETDDLVEKIGVERARKYIESADLILMILDISREIGEEDKRILELLADKPVIFILNKADLQQAAAEDLLTKITGGRMVVYMSAVNGEGLEDLKDEIEKMVSDKQIDANNELYITNLRQLESLKKAVYHLSEVLTAVNEDVSIEFLEIDLKMAWEALGEITGETVSENIIDKIFSQFCIGK